MHKNDREILLFNMFKKACNISDSLVEYIHGGIGNDLSYFKIFDRIPRNRIIRRNEYEHLHN